MGYLKLVFFGFVLLIVSGYQIVVKGVSAENTKTLYDEQSRIQNLVEEFYEWYETRYEKNDFAPVADPENLQYTGMDIKKHHDRLDVLRRTGFFANEFLDNYDRIMQAVDSGLKSKELEWPVGDLPPYGNGANPWYNSQDTPDSYWKQITINNIYIDNEVATFSWSWDERFSYKMKAVRENDHWKILYMEGFDMEELFHRVTDSA